MYKVHYFTYFVGDRRIMFPVSGVQSGFLPVANNETGTVYPQWIYSYNNSFQSSYALPGNAAGFSGLRVNDIVQPYPYEHQVHVVLFLSKMYVYLK